MGKAAASTKKAKKQTGTKQNQEADAPGPAQRAAVSKAKHVQIPPAKTTRSGRSGTGGGRA